MHNPEEVEPLRSLPSVDQVLRRLDHLPVPHSLLATEIRNVIERRRESLIEGREVPGASIEQEVERQICLLLSPSLRPVINATGVILHTNLGRAPLAQFVPLAGYSNLEYDLASGKRGRRDVHVGRLLQCLLGRPAVVVNNNAAAVYLVLNELAAGSEVIVSRGELIEIGDGFRIPEIMARSGAVLREVGTTNRTRIDDYTAAITDHTKLILRVHPSNFRISGFTERPSLEALSQLGSDHHIPVYEDLGSGCLADLRAQGIDEPVVSESLEAGVNILSFSCDKLLGGPQSGIIAGEAELVSRVRRNPLYRVMRVDKLILQALETTLRHVLLEQWSAIPALRMIFTNSDELHRRAERIADKLTGAAATVRQSESPIGGGSTPDQTLPSWVVELEVRNAARFERDLRQATRPVIARIEHDKIILDIRTVDEDEEALLISAVLAAANR